MSRIIPPLTEEQRAALIISARSMLGMKFRHQGRTTRAADCLGFAALALAGIGIEIEPRTDYGRSPAHDLLARELENYLGPPINEVPLPGDFVTCSWAVEPSHVALVTPHPAYGIGMIHCYLTAGKVVEHGIDPLWLTRIRGVYRT